jgi:CRP-like cAMP-binding protein
VDVPAPPGSPLPHAVTADQVASCLPRDLVREAAALAAQMHTRHLAPGQVAMTRGRSVAGVCVIRSGAVELGGGNRRDRKVLALLGPCDIFGDVPLLLGEAACFTARAAEPVRLAFLPAPRFRALLETRPDLARGWLAALARRHARLQADRHGALAGGAERRTADLLLRQARDGQVSASQDTLAAMIGIRRPTLNRILKTFERDGLIDLHYRAITLRRPQDLHHRTLR